MLQVIYVSVATVPFSTADLTALLTKARATNEDLGISGMLVHDNGTFLQVLEGPDKAVVELYDKIEQDHRHARTLVLWKREIEERAFGEWRMGFAEAGHGALDALPGYCRFFHPSHFLETEDPDGSKAFDVLCKFRDGAYRRAS